MSVAAAQWPGAPPSQRRLAALVPMGSAGAKAVAAVRGETEVYLQSGAQSEWDRCTPVSGNRDDTTRDDTTNPLGITKDSLRRSTGSGHRDVQTEMAKNIAFSIPLSDWRAHDEGAASTRAAFAVLEEIAPSDALDGMLATQMLTVHNTAMECFERAMIGKEPVQVINMYLRQAARLTSIYERQVAALISGADVATKPFVWST